MNCVSLVGRLVRDPEQRRTENGTAWAMFDIAVNRTFRSADGVEADFFRVVCWSKLAENVGNYCNKGMLVSVNGRLQSRSYQRNDGSRATIIEVIANEVQFLSTKQQQSKNQNHVGIDNFDDSINSYDLIDSDIQF